MRKYIVKRPMIARRHSFDTGALRMFDVVYVDSLSSLDESLATKATLDGVVVVCLSESNSLSEQFQVRAKALDGLDNVVIAVPQQIGELREVIAELAASALGLGKYARTQGRPRSSKRSLTSNHRS